VSKRVRGSSHRRPGTRPPSERPAGTSRPPSTVARFSQLEAAEIIADDVVENKPAEAAAELERAARAAHPRHRVKPGSILAARAATEYVYVAQDMRRILIVAALLFGVLIVLWLALVVFRVVPLSFY
jgi:hypothetical protein